MEFIFSEIQEMSTCFRMHLPVGHDTFEKKKVKIYPSRRSKSLISLRNQYNNGKGRAAKFSRLFSKTFPFLTKKLAYLVHKCPL